MKKIALILSVFMVSALGANAYIDSQYTSSDQFLTNIGYSHAVRDTVEGKVLDPYRQSYQEGKDFKSLVKRAYGYIAPGENNDVYFINHSTDVNGFGWKDF